MSRLLMGNRGKKLLKKIMLLYTIFRDNLSDLPSEKKVRSLKPQSQQHTYNLRFRYAAILKATLHQN